MLTVPDRSLHILLMQFYTSSPPPDLDEMAVALRSWGHTVWLATPNARGEMEWRNGNEVVAVQSGPARMPEIVVRILPLRMIATRLSFLRFMIKLRAFVRKSGADIIHVTPPQYACVMPLFMPERMRFVLDVRQAGEVAGDGVFGKLRNLKSRVGLRLNARLMYDHACFATEAAARRILGKRWSRWASIHRVGQHPGFLSYRWNSANGVRAKGNTVSFIYVGTLSRLRRLEQILSAVQWLLERTKNVHLDFVGPDEAGGYYQALVRSMNLSHVVTIHPPVRYHEVPEIVAAHDVALAYVPPLPDWQVQPTLKVLEYRALGVPIIASDNEPNREVVQNGINGILIQDSVESLGEAMLRFASDSEFLEQCAARARAMRQGRTWNDAAKLYETVAYSGAPQRSRN